MRIRGACPSYGALLALLSVVCLMPGGAAFAQTDTPTATPTNTPTTVPYGATPLATATPALGSTRQFSGSTSFSGAVKVNSDLKVLPDAEGGNATDRNELIGRVKCKPKALSTGTNGTTETALLLDDTPTGEWTAIDASAVLTADTTYYKIGSASLKIAFAAGATNGDGAVGEITNDDWTAAGISNGFWIRPSEPTVDGDLRLYVDDTTSDASFLIPGVDGDKWTWVEIDVSALASTVGDAVDKVRIELTTQGATNHLAFDVQLDGYYKWKSTDEAALGVDLVPEGVQGVQALATSAVVDVAEYTDFFVAYREGNDSLVYITDQSTKNMNAFVCYQ